MSNTLKCAITLTQNANNNTGAGKLYDSKKNEGSCFFYSLKEKLSRILYRADHHSHIDLPCKARHIFICTFLHDVTGLPLPNNIIEVQPGCYELPV